MRDDLGVFHPIGISGFTFLHMRHERPEAYAVETQTLVDAGVFDAVSVYGCLEPYSFRDCSPNVTWPDYWQNAEAFIVEMWERARIRTEIITMDGESMGSQPGLKTEDDWNRHIDGWGALARKHPEKILMIRITHESGNPEAIVKLAERLQSQCDVMVAPDTVGSQQHSVQLYGNKPWKIAGFQRDRDTAGTGGTWEPMWDIFEWPITDGSAEIVERVRDIEPAGPYSSQWAYFEVEEIAFQAWLAMVLGASGTTFHDGVGIRHGGEWDCPPVFDQNRARDWGVYNTGQGIPARYQDTPHWNEIIAALRSVKAVVPVGIANWRRWNGHWNDNPVCYKPYRNPAPGWPDGVDNGPFDDGTLFKAVTAIGPTGQVVTSYLGLAHKLDGIFGRQPMHLRELDPRDATQILREFDTSPEQPFTIERPMGMFQGELL